MKYRILLVTIILLVSMINSNLTYADNNVADNAFDEVLSGSAIEVLDVMPIKDMAANSSVSVLDIISDGKYYIDESTNIKNIVIADNVAVDVTICNLNLDLTDANGVYGKSAIYIGENSKVNLIIQGNNKLISDECAAGIYVGLDSTLTIDGNGFLEVNSELGCAIGGSVHDYDYNSSGLFGNIVINGGTITAKSQYGAGIGGTPSWSKHVDEPESRISSETYCNTGNIIINGGNITAIGGKGSAGIGGSQDNGIGDYIAIYDGVVNAYGGYHASGIGYGEKGYAINRNIEGDIRIYGGEINAYGGENASGIGNGYDSNEGPTIEIYGGSITAYGGKDADGIDVSYPRYSIYSGWIEVCAGTVTAIGNGNGYGIDTHQIWINGGSVKAEGVIDINTGICARNYNTDKPVSVNKIYAPNVSNKTVKINGFVTIIPSNHPNDDYIYVYASEGDTVTIEGGDINGDVNDDGKVTTADALVVARLAIGKIANNEIYTVCDYNKDGKVTTADALVLARYAIGKISSL